MSKALQFLLLPTVESELKVHPDQLYPTPSTMKPQEKAQQEQAKRIQQCQQESEPHMKLATR